jgi:hypothetical protein
MYLPFCLPFPIILDVMIDSYASNEYATSNCQVDSVYVGFWNYFHHGTTQSRVRQRDLTHQG